jgi:hypothetical protein
MKVCQITRGASSCMIESKRFSRLARVTVMTDTPGVHLRASALPQAAFGSGLFCQRPPVRLAVLSVPWPASHVILSAVGTPTEVQLSNKKPGFCGKPGFFCVLVSGPSLSRSKASNETRRARQCWISSPRQSCANRCWRPGYRRAQTCTPAL